MSGRYECRIVSSFAEEIVSARQNYSITCRVVRIGGSKCGARQLPRQFGGVHRAVARLIHCVWNSLRIYYALYEIPDYCQSALAGRKGGMAWHDWQTRWPSSLVRLRGSAGQRQCYSYGKVPRLSWRTSPLRP